MARVFAGLRLAVAFVCVLYVSALFFLAVSMVVFHCTAYGFTPMGLRGIVAATCLAFAGWFLAFPLSAGCREKMFFFLTCLTLYSVGKGMEGAVVDEWLMLAILGLAILMCQRLVEIGNDWVR